TIESMLRGLAVLAILGVLACAGLYVAAGRTAPPILTVDKPDRIVGQQGTIEVTAVTPRPRLTALTITLEQNGRTLPLFALDQPQTASLNQLDPEHLRISRPFGKQAVPELQAGPARIVVAASRRSFLNLRTVSATTSKTVQVRLEPPRIAVISTHHY